MKNALTNSGKKTYGNRVKSGGGFLSASYDKPLVPSFLFYYMIFVALTLPNLIFSGTGWFDTLHIMKWTFAMVPIAAISLVGGGSLCLFGGERTGFKLDPFGWLWLLMLGYISVQATWVNITSWSTFIKEWFFFATLFGTYVFCYNLFKDSGYHKLILWFANINAALNVVFAELLIRNINGPFPFIMNVPGNYIGNTGQQEMFGLWMAMALMNGIYLHVAFGNEEGSSHQKRWMQFGNLFLLAVNAWGLWNSTTRGGMLSLFVGTLVLFIIVLRTQDKAKLKRMAQMVFVIIFMLAATLGIGKITNVGRSAALIAKTTDMFEHVSSVGKRSQIWRSSWAVFANDPIRGVGIGHFKWHYLDGQRMTYEKHPDTVWQYTYWAHSEYIQWLAEFGIFGGILLLIAGVWWLWSFVSAMIKKKVLSSEAIWACSMIFLVWFDAIFSRPFHRIENVLWLAFAFAIANRELLVSECKWTEIRHSWIFRALGALFAVISICGLIFLGTGLVGDKYLHSSVRTNNAGLQAYRISKALALPMARDEAEEQYAYHLMAIAKVTQKQEDWNKAINQLYKSFMTRPQAKQLMELVNFAAQTNNQELLRRLVPYLKPGTFSTVPSVPGASK